MTAPDVVEIPFARVSFDDAAATAIERAVAVEMPVAIAVNGIGYAVLMTTPRDLEDLAYGFALAERLIDGAVDVLGVDIHPDPRGMLVRISLDERVAGRALDRVRHRISESACGLCGIENLEQAMRPLPPLARRWQGEDAAVFRALSQIDDLQPLNQRTRAVHGAAACANDGMPWLMREDVGRHNAFDKLIGAMLRAGRDWDGGFALLTSRCSYELVEKAVISGCPMLATISAPTSLAIERAAAAGLALRVVARSDALLSLADTGREGTRE